MTSSKCLIFADYKQKVLPAKHKEAQSESFGKKGKSLFGMAAVMKLPDNYDGPIPKDISREGDYVIAYIRIAADDSDQDFSHSVQCCDVGLQHLKKAYPWLDEVLLYTDGAGNFRSTSFQLQMTAASAAAELPVVAHLVPEAGDGKDRCDRDFNGVNQLFKSWLKQPKASIQNAREIVAALEAGKRKGDGVINCAIHINRPSGPKSESSTAMFTSKVRSPNPNLTPTLTLTLTLTWTLILVSLS